MTNTKANFDRILYLDGLRGIAALAVAVMHFPLVNYITNNSFISNSFLFVDFFFVLSGFIIAKLYRESSDKVSFMRHRVARIAPVFYLTLFFGVILELLKIFLPSIATTQAFSGSNDIFSLLREITMIHAFPFFDNTSFNPPNWSISSEFFAYFIFAALMGLSIKKRFYLWLILFISCLLYSPFVTDLSNAHDLAMYRCIFGFSCGVLISMININSSLSKNSYDILLNCIFIISIIAIFLYIFTGGSVYFPPALAFGFFLIIVIKCNCSSRKILFENNIVIFLGEVSLSVYLVHFFVVMRFEELNNLIFKDSIEPEVLLITYVILLLIICYIINVRFEKPMRRLLR